MRQEKIARVILGTAAALTITLLYFFIDARHSNFFPSCPFFTFTGLYCPGCGSQRAISSILHLDFREAIGHNVMLVLSLPFILYSAWASVSNIFSAKPVVQKIFYNPLFVTMFLIAVVLFGILRNIPAYPFTLLAP